MLTGEMMANAANETQRCLAKKKKAQRKKAKKHSRQPPELDTTNSEPSGTDRETNESSSDHDGYDTDEISYSKEQPFDFQGPDDHDDDEQEMEQN